MLNSIKYAVKVHKTVEIPHSSDQEEQDHGFLQRFTGNQARGREIKEVANVDLE